MSMFTRGESTFCGIPRLGLLAAPVADPGVQLEGQQTQHHLPLQGLFTGAHRSVVALKDPDSNMLGRRLGHVMTEIRYMYFRGIVISIISYNSKSLVVKQ